MKAENHRKKIEEFVGFKESPHKHSLKAYNEGYYFEAFTVIHGFLAGQMKAILHLYSHKINKTPLSVAWDINEKLTYYPLAHVLFTFQIITKHEYDILVAFNSMRNELIHKFYLDLYENTYDGITKKKCNSCYKAALKLSEKFEILMHEMIE